MRGYCEHCPVDGGPCIVCCSPTPWATDNYLWVVLGWLLGATTLAAVLILAAKHVRVSS